MAKASSQKFIARNRAPRVQIEYDVEIYGSEKKVQLPFVMGVMSDLSGKPTEPLPPVADRKFLEIDVDNFDDRLKAMKPRVAFTVPNTLTGEGNLAVDITFESMDDFSPAAVARKVERAEQAARGAHAAVQPADLHGRQDRRGGADRQGAARIRRCCSRWPSAPKPGRAVRPTGRNKRCQDPEPSAAAAAGGADRRRPAISPRCCRRSSSRRPTGRARRSRARCRRWPQQALRRHAPDLRRRAAQRSRR